MNKIFSLTIFLFLSLVSIGQDYTTDNKKAIKLYEEAKFNFLSYKMVEAEELLKQAIKKDSSFVEAFNMLSGTYFYRDMEENDLAILNTCTRLNGEAYPSTYLWLATQQLFWGKYEDCKQTLDVANAYKHVFSKNDRDKFDKLLLRCKFALYNLNNPVPFEPRNLGSSINTQYDDYLPSITADEQKMLITSRIPYEGSQDNAPMKETHEDFFISYKMDSTWSPRKNIGKPINTLGNEGAQTMTADGTMLFFTACERPDGFGSCDIYYSFKKGNKWTVPRNVGRPINTRYWESQPAVSADGRELYFISNRPGGYGKTDIWVSTLDSYGEWTQPRNLGNIINTEDEELSPFIHADNNTMYFASKGWMGMGGSDIFVSRRDTGIVWSEPKNIGYPINTHQDESDIRVAAKGDLAYFSSDRLEGEGGIDIYAFELYEEMRPKEVSYVRGNIYDAKTLKKLSAKFELIDLKTRRLVIEAYSDPVTGDFLVPLPVHRSYALNVSKEQYLFHSENFIVESLINTYSTKDLSIALKPIEVGRKVVLNNIFFDTDSDSLKPESRVELEKLGWFLKQNTTVKIEISGHTDNTGSAYNNKALSYNRAKAVYNNLVNQGVSAGRLKYTGKGATEPLAPNDSEANKALNRRTEVKILEY